MVAVTLAAVVAVAYPVAPALIETEPMSKPVICGWTAGAVCPVAIVTEEGEIVSFAGLALVRLIVTALAAGAPSVTGKAVDRPRPTLALDGRLMDPGADTVIAAVALGMFGVTVDAVIVADPWASGVTGTLTLF